MENRGFQRWIFFAFFIVIGQAILYLEKLPTLDMIYSSLRTMIFPILCLQYIQKKVHWNILYTLLLLYFGVILYSSLIHHSESLVPLISLGMTSASLLLCMAIGSKRNFNLTLKIFRNVFSIYVLLNFIFIILYPDGVWMDTIGTTTLEEVGRYIIGGNYNQMGASMLCASVVNSVYYFQTGKGKALLILIIVISVTSLFIVGSKTSLVGILLFSIFLMLKNSKVKVLSLNAFIVFYFVFQILAVFMLSDLSNNSIARYIVEDVLQKDMSFSSRTNIWFRTAIAVAESPLLGYGLQEPEWNQLYINGVSTHNYIYSVLMKGGFVLLACLVFIIISVMRRERKYRSLASITALFGLWILLFMMIMEVYNIIYIVFLLGLLTCLYTSQKNNVLNEKNKCNNTSLQYS